MESSAVHSARSNQLTSRASGDGDVVRVEANGGAEGGTGALEQVTRRSDVDRGELCFLILWLRESQVGANLHPLPRERIGVLGALGLDRDALDEDDLIVHSTDEHAWVLRMHLVADALDLIVSHTRDECDRSGAEERMESCRGLRTHVKILQRREIRNACEVCLGVHAYVSARGDYNQRAEGPAAHGPFGAWRPWSSLVKVIIDYSFG